MPLYRSPTVIWYVIMSVWIFETLIFSTSFFEKNDGLITICQFIVSSGPWFIYLLTLKLIIFSALSIVTYWVIIVVLLVKFVIKRKTGAADLKAIEKRLKGKLLRVLFITSLIQVWFHSSNGLPNACTVKTCYKETWNRISHGLCNFSYNRRFVECLQTFIC